MRKELIIVKLSAFIILPENLCKYFLIVNRTWGPRWSSERTAGRWRCL